MMMTAMPVTVVLMTTVMMITLRKERLIQVQQVRQEQHEMPPVGVEPPLEGRLTGK